MPTYSKLIEKLNQNVLEELEIKSSSRQYNRYTLFTRHYFYHKKLEDKGVKELIQNMNYLKTEIVQQEDFSSLLSTDSSDSVSTASSLSSNLTKEELKINEIWNGLDSEKQIFWSNRALKLKKLPLQGQF